MSLLKGIGCKIALPFFVCSQSWSWSRKRKGAWQGEGQRKRRPKTIGCNSVLLDFGCYSNTLMVSF